MKKITLKNETKVVVNNQETSVPNGAKVVVDEKEISVEESERKWNQQKRRKQSKIVSGIIADFYDNLAEEIDELIEEVRNKFGHSTYLNYVKSVKISVGHWQRDHYMPSIVYTRDKMAIDYVKDALED